MSNPKQTVVRPGGIVTTPNEYGELPPGTLAQGMNVMMRRQGVLEPRPSFEVWKSTALSPCTPVKIRPISTTRAVNIEDDFAGDTRLRILDSTTGTGFNFSVGPDIGPSPNYLPGKTGITVAREQVIVTAENAPYIFPIDITGLENSRQAGLPAPFITLDQSVSGSVWAANKYIAYKALFRYGTANEYTHYGQVSPAIIRLNGGSARGPLLSVTWNPTGPIAEGLVLEFYRVLQQDTSDLLGDDYRYAFSYTLTSTDISNGYVQVMDTCLETALGAYLYTNESQDGSSKSNWMPPTSNDVYTFKQATFYVTPTAFHTVTARIAARWGDLSTTEERTYGIGSRQTTATSNSGVDTINVTNATGIKIGQILRTTIGGLDNTRVTNVVGNIVTLSAPASATIVGGTVSFRDVISINGITIDMYTPESLATGIYSAIIASDLPVIVYAEPAIDMTLVSVDGQKLTFVAPVAGSAAFTIEATNGANYHPALAEYSGTAQTSVNDPRTNRLHFSKEAQPEAVPVDNTLLVGEGTILKLASTEDALFVFCTDGIFRIDGDGAEWAVRPYDLDTFLVSPEAVDSLDNNIYALTNYGLISLSDSGGVRRISEPLNAEVFDELLAQFSSADTPTPYSWNVQLACDKTNAEVWINFNDLDDDFAAAWIWNAGTNTFMQQDMWEPTAIGYAPFLKSVLVSDASGGILNIRKAATSSFMYPNTVVFNPVVADDLGLLKQWIDVTLMLQGLDDEAFVTPQFDDVEYANGYILAQNTGRFEHVIVPLRNSVHSKECNFGFMLGDEDEGGGSVYWQLKGVSYKYRLASDELRR